MKVFRSVVWSGLRVALREFSAWHSDYGVCFVVRSSESSFRVLIARGTSLKLLRRTQCAFDVSVFLCLGRGCVSVVIRVPLKCAFGSFCQDTNHTQVAQSFGREVIFLGIDEVVLCCGSWWNWLLHEMRRCPQLTDKWRTARPTWNVDHNLPTFHRIDLVT